MADVEELLNERFDGMLEGISASIRPHACGPLFLRALQIEGYASEKILSSHIVTLMTMIAPASWKDLLSLWINPGLLDKMSP